MTTRLWYSCSFRAPARRLFMLICVLSLFLPSLTAARAFQPSAPKRPLTHGDYDRWRSIQGPQLSPDGRFLSYLLMPQDGDGEVVVRQLATGTEWRYGRGWRPPLPLDLSDAAAWGGFFNQIKRLTHAFFTSDSRFALFIIEPSREEVAGAKREKKKRAELPKNALGVMDLSTGRVIRIDRVRSFQLPAEGGDVIAYLLEPNSEEGAAEKMPKSAGAPDSIARSVCNRLACKKPGEYGSELVLYDLASQRRRAFADVLEYSLSEDARSLVYTVSSRTGETNGVYVIAPGSDQAPAALLAGAGRYRRLTWDEGQTQLAFLSDRDEAASERPRYKLYHWDRQAPRAAAIVSVETPGFRRGLMISDQAPLSFSSDGSRLFLGVSPPLKT
ncbi:MAG TPA: hypothetical protein VJ302_20165, partial [Blastocatellia bacterium]|nr:hypothetical protein [Blastocatellia bacterium]